MMRTYLKVLVPMLKNYNRFTLKIKIFTLKRMIAILFIFLFNNHHKYLFILFFYFLIHSELGQAYVNTHYDAKLQCFALQASSFRQGTSFCSHYYRKTNTDELQNLNCFVYNLFDAKRKMGLNGEWNVNVNLRSIIKVQVQCNPISWPLKKVESQQPASHYEYQCKGRQPFLWYFEIEKGSRNYLSS